MLSLENDFPSAGGKVNKPYDVQQNQPSPEPFSSQLPARTLNPPSRALRYSPPNLSGKTKSVLLFCCTSHLFVYFHFWISSWESHEDKSECVRFVARRRVCLLWLPVFTLVLIFNIVSQQSSNTSWPVPWSNGEEMLASSLAIEWRKRNFDILCLSTKDNRPSTTQLSWCAQCFP